MLSITRPLTRPINRSIATVLAAAGLAVAAPATTARAQDAKLSVSASPSVLRTGQTALVHVRAHLPAGVYAFASSQFDVHSTHPMWAFASSGAIAGTDVIGASASQTHSPHTGIVAVPTNPYPVWNGLFTPTSAGPALIEIAADPTTFSVYPSKLTSSSAPRRSSGGSDWLLLNPLSVGQWLAAPGRGTTAAVHDDVILDGKIITAENPTSAILIGLLLPAVQSARSESIVRFDGLPDSFSAGVQIERDIVPTDQFSINFTRIDFLPGPGGDSTGVVNVCMGDGSVKFMRYTAFRGGVAVATGDLERPGQGGLASLAVESVPPALGVRIGPATPGTAQPRPHADAVWSLRYEQPVKALVRGPDGESRPVVIDSIEVRTPLSGSAAPVRHTHNIKQLGLAVHTFAATGVRSMSIMPKQPE